MGIEQFLGKLASDKDLLAKAQNVNGVDDLIALAQEAGHDVTKEDLDSLVHDLASGAGKLLSSFAPAEDAAPAADAAPAEDTAPAKEAAPAEGVDMNMIAGLLGNILKQ